MWGGVHGGRPLYFRVVRSANMKRGGAGGAAYEYDLIDVYPQ